MAGRKRPHLGQIQDRQPFAIAALHRLWPRSLIARSFFFLLSLLLPVLAAPGAMRLIDSRRYTPRAIAEIEIIYPILFWLYGFIIQRRSVSLFPQFPSPKWRSIFISTLYAQVSFHALVVIGQRMSGQQAIIHVILFILTVVYAILIFLRPSFGLVVIYAVSSVGLCLWALLSLYLGIQIDIFSFSFETLADNLPAPALWVVSLTIAMIMLLKGLLQSHRPQRPLRYAIGLGVIMTVILFADLYYEAALLTRGDAFEYNKKAIELQSKLRLASLFPGLPSKLYDSLIEASIPPPAQPMIQKDTQKGVDLNAADPDDEIGGSWADFYQRRLKLDGATHYRLVKFDENFTTVDYQLLVYKFNAPRSLQQEQEWHDFLGIKLYDGHSPPSSTYVVEFPKSMAYHDHLSPTEESDPLPSNAMRIQNSPHDRRSIIVHFRSKTDLVPDIYADYVLDIESLPLYLQHAHNYLDDSEHKVREITETNYLDTFSDYLYFSVVTMSTTGYGDIIAIHPAVRALTITEIAIGWFLLLWFGALILSGINKSGSDQPEQKQRAATATS